MVWVMTGLKRCRKCKKELVICTIRKLYCSATCKKEYYINIRAIKYANMLLAKYRNKAKPQDDDYQYDYS